MTTIQRPNTRHPAIVIVVVCIFVVTAAVIKKSIKPAQANAGAVYAYASEPQWYNGPVARPTLSGDYMGFLTLWEGNGWNLYTTDLNKKKDYKITFDGPVSHIADPAVSNNFVAWNDTTNNKWQIKLFDVYLYTTKLVEDTMNEVARPAMSGDKIVWRESNSDSFGNAIRFYDNSTTQITTLAAGKWFTDPVIVGNHVAWLQSTNDCPTWQAYRLCTPENATWDVVVTNLDTHATDIVARNVYLPHAVSPALTLSSVIWVQKGDAYDVKSYSLRDTTTTLLLHTTLEKTDLVASNGRLAYIGISETGSPKIVHVLDLDTKEDVAMTYNNADQEHVTLSGNRVAWSEVRDDSRIYIYDFRLTGTSQDVNYGVTTAKAQTVGTNSTNKDSDGDGIPDTDEVVLFHTNPLAMDSDGDGLSDYQEIYIYHTDPNKFDTDGDGYGDGREVANNYNPLDPRPIKVAKNFFEPTVSVKAAAIK